MSAFWLIPMVTSIWILAGVFSLWRVRRHWVRWSGERVPVSVLKPLCGLESTLEDDLESFFLQDHTEFELIFGVEGADDPAIPVVRSLQAKYPHVRSRLVVHQGGPAFNPKVRNLQQMLPYAHYDVILISDSNVSVPNHYVREMADAIVEDGVGLVTSLFRLRSAHSVGAFLEGLELGGLVGVGVAAPNVLLGDAYVIGKSMMLRQSQFQKLGGFEAVAYVLAEDFVIGQAYHRAGLRVRIVPTIIDSGDPNQSLRSMFGRHHRWSVMRRVMAPMITWIEPLSMPLVVAALGAVLGEPMIPLFGWAVVATLIRDGLGWYLVQGRAGLLQAFFFVPLRDIVHLMFWIQSTWSRDVSWRGTSLQVSLGSRLYPTSIGSVPESVVVPSKSVVRSRVRRPE